MSALVPINNILDSKGDKEYVGEALICSVTFVSLICVLNISEANNALSSFFVPQSVKILDKKLLLLSVPDNHTIGNSPRFCINMLMGLVGGQGICQC
jgi:hypothetical protein